VLDCLIIQIQDHRSSSAASPTTSTSSTRDKNVPFSIHNYNEHVTPSPFVPYPHSNSTNRTSLKAATNTNGAAPAQVDAEKENVKPKEEDSTEPTSKNLNKGPKTFTTVLFPTSMSLQEELLTYASQPDPRVNNRKHSQINGRTPGSATMPHPPTPSSAVSSTPFSFGQPAKKVKMMFNSKDLLVMEEKIVNATAPPLYLEPVNGPDEVELLLQKLQDPLHCAEPPAPKTRKRTVAELAADEALAAEEQRFMLIMDERLVPSSTGVGAGKAAATDGEAGAASFEPRFERFKAIEEIKATLKEKAEREAREKHAAQLQSQANKARLEQQQREVQHQQMNAKIQAQRRNAEIRTLQAHQMQHQSQQMMQQQGSQGSMNQHAHPSNPNTVMAGAHQMAAAQAHHSSPVTRNMTPNSNSSPVVGAMMSQGGQSMSMNRIPSNQTAGSPARPGSALQHAHPVNASVMNAQRSQQPQSGNGTPQMQNSTPRLGQATPVMANVTPTPRVSQASPNHPNTVVTPIMAQTMMATQRANGPQASLQQQQMLLHRQQQQAAQAQFAQQQQQQARYQQQMQGSSPNNPMSAQGSNLQQLATHQAHQAHQQQAAALREKEEQYRQQLQMQMANQMNQNHQPNGQLAPNGMNLQQQQQAMHMSQQQQGYPHQGVPQQQQMRPEQVLFFRRICSEMYQRSLAQAKAQYGPNLPPQMTERLQQAALAKARETMKQQGVQQQMYAFQQQQAQAQQQQMANMGNGGMMGGMGGMGGMPHGMPGM
jgi:transcription factor SPT20